MAEHLGLKIKFVDYLRNDTHGKLLPREKRILINAHKPRIEHFYTVLHEIGHFLLHFKNPHRKHHHPFLEIDWKNKWLSDLCSKVRRLLRLIYARESGREFEADVWAMCAFIHLTNTIGCRDDLTRFLDRHPEKLPAFLLAVWSTTYTTLKKRINNFANSAKTFLKFRRI